MVPGDEANYLTNSELEMTSVCIPLARLENTVQDLLRCTLEGALPETRIYESDPQTVFQLCGVAQTACQTLSQLPESTAGKVVEDELEGDLLLATCRVLEAAQPVRSPRLAWKQRNKYKRQARELQKGDVVRINSFNQTDR
jgi:hypothetical protein